MTRVLLINPPAPERAGSPLLGLQYVAAALLNRGCDVRVMDAAAIHFSQDAEWIVSQASTFAPHLVGIGLFTPGVCHAYRLVERLREKFPLLVAGGPHATALPAEAIGHGFDIALVGEAERAIVRIVDWIEGQTTLGSIPGAFFRGADGNIHSGPPRILIDDLDKLPPPTSAAQLFDAHWYQASEKPVIPGGVLASRGCPAQCIFCANCVTGRRLRWRSARNIAAELNYWHHYSGTTFFAFWDDSLTADRKRILELCDILRRDIRFELRWSAITRANMVDSSVLRAMKTAGCIAINFGVESGDDQILRAIGKGTTTQQVREALQYAKEEGLQTLCNFMMGFPQEKPENLDHTLHFMESIAPLVDFFSTLGVVVPFPGTLLYEKFHKKHGFTNWWLREQFNRNTSVLQHPSDSEDFRRQYADDPALENDFFHYSEEMRRMIRACLQFKAEHNLSKMGIGSIPLT